MDVPSLPGNSPATAERKLVALLICDVQELTAAGPQHDPEDSER
jgi:hypothetical protein